MATSGTPPLPPDFEAWSEKDFAAIMAFLRNQIGISLESHRMGLMQARLRSRLQSKGYNSFTQFHEQVLRVEPSGWGTQLLIDLSTVNHTSFFREPAHFTFTAEKVAAWLKESPELDDPDLVGGMLVGPGTVQHGHGPGRDTLPAPVAEGRDLGQRPVPGDAQGRRRRDLHVPGRSGRFAPAASAVLLAGRRASRRLISRSSPRSATS